MVGGLGGHRGLDISLVTEGVHILSLNVNCHNGPTSLSESWTKLLGGPDTSSCHLRIDLAGRAGGLTPAR